MVQLSETAAPSAVLNGIVLAAGHSTRMGRPKPLLEIDDESFVARAVRVLQAGGCRGVIVAIAPDQPEVRQQAEQAGAKIVENRIAGAEPIDSLRLCLAAVEPEASGVVVLPVDHPLVREGTIAELIAAYRRSGAPIVRPVYRGVPGHPGIFDRRMFAELDDPSLRQGAHSVVEAHAGEVLDLPVNDSGVAANVDTPDDYRRFVEGSC